MNSSMRLGFLSLFWATILLDGIGARSAIAASSCAPELLKGSGTILSAAAPQASNDLESYSRSLMNGNVVLIDLWANWCGPCIAGMAELRGLQEQFRDRGLRVIGATDQSYGDARTQAIIRQRQLNYDTVSQADLIGSIQSELGLEPYIPQVVLLDRNGEIRFKGHPSDLPDGLIEELLASPVDPAKKAACEASRLIKPLTPQKSDQSGSVIQLEGASLAKPGLPQTAPGTNSGRPAAGHAAE